MTSGLSFSLETIPPSSGWLVLVYCFSISSLQKSLFQKPCCFSFLFILGMSESGKPLVCLLDLLSVNSFFFYVIPDPLSSLAYGKGTGKTARGLHINLHGNRHGKKHAVFFPLIWSRSPLEFPPEIRRLHPSQKCGLHRG